MPTRSRSTSSRTASTTCWTSRCRCRSGRRPDVPLMSFVGAASAAAGMQADPVAADAASAIDVLALGAIDVDAARALLARYGLTLHLLADGADIPGSYW